MTQDPATEAAAELSLASPPDDAVLEQLRTGALDPDGVGPWPGGGGHPSKYSIPIGMLTGMVKPILSTHSKSRAQANHEVAAYILVRRLELWHMAAPTVLRQNLHTTALGAHEGAVAEGKSGLVARGDLSCFSEGDILCAAVVDVVTGNSDRTFGNNVSSLQQAPGRLVPFLHDFGNGFWDPAYPASDGAFVESARGKQVPATLMQALSRIDLDDLSTELAPYLQPDQIARVRAELERIRSTGVI